MSIDADVRRASGSSEPPHEPRTLGWRTAVRERRAKARQLRALIRRFNQGR